MLAVRFFSALLLLLAHFVQFAVGDCAHSNQIGPNPVGGTSKLHTSFPVRICLGLVCMRITTTISGDYTQLHFGVFNNGFLTCFVQLYHEELGTWLSDPVRVYSKEGCRVDGFSFLTDYMGQGIGMLAKCA